MNGRWDHDRRLLGDLHAALAGPSADDFLSPALAAFRIGRAGGPAAVAGLVFDSACDPPPAGAVRSVPAALSAQSARLLTFRADRCTVDVEIHEDGMLGQVHLDLPDPLEGRPVTGQTPDRAFGAARLDAVGGFELPLPAPGPVRLRLDLPDRTVVTSWLVLRYP
ncbi:hypothetical protein [Dactylosporangium sp. NPDC005555]|uniref:hypothetical protein n=1 Tax=Dactylosporangium sp. NPDC005555 TaxID=3154889 RepID=UPI0033AB64A3